MNPRVIFVWVSLWFASSFAIAQEKSITMEQALSIVQSYYEGQDVDYYLLTERTEQWEIFVDEVPFANWEHDCAIYTFLNTFNLAIDTIPQKVALKMPPTEEFTPLETGRKKNVRHVSVLEPTIIQPGSIVSDNEIANRTFAVILSGGFYEHMNYHRYWNDCSFIYQTLRKAYGIPRSNIKVVMSDGCDPAADIKLPDYSLISSPLDLDCQDGDDITCSATKENIYAVLNSLLSVMDKDDHFFLYVIDHGGSYNVPESISYINLWDQARLYDYELADALLPFTQKGINVNIVMGQCNSGGFTEELTNIGCVVATACGAEESSYARPRDTSEQEFDYDEFVFHWTSAINGADPYGNAVNADADNNGIISMLEAFNYAKANDQFSNGQNDDAIETPQYASAPISLGEDLAFNHLPQSLDLFIKDFTQDSGVENNQMSEAFWLSPSIWVRNDDDDETEHQNPTYSADDSEAFVYVKVHNRGRDNYAGGTKWIHVNWALASTAASVKSWQGSELYGGLQTGGALTPVTIPALTSGDSCIVKVPWELPAEQMQQDTNSEQYHLNIIARIMDTPTIESYTDNSPLQFDIRGMNNYALKSVALVSNTETAKSANVMTRNICDSEACYSLELRPHILRDTLLFERANVELTLTQSLLNAWASGNYSGEDITYSSTEDPLTIHLNSANSKLSNITMSGEQLDLLSLKFDFHTPSVRGLYFNLDLIQRNNDGSIVGGQTYVIEAPFAIITNGDITEPGPIGPIDPELPPIGGGIITLGANLDGTELISEWTDANDVIIGNSTTVEVTPTPQNNTYSLRVLTADGGLYNDSITLEPTLGIKSVTNSTNHAGSIVVEFLSKTFAANSHLTLQSVNQAMTPIKYSVPVGIEHFEIDMTNLQQGLYAVTYVVDGTIINTAKFSK
ncbi:MAG: hypothetical protein E7082_03810 [Bacteroidales bacterium]|nr:hypothetical protein [Bacteroidales bacterium]